MVDSSYQLRRLESDDSSPHQARKVTLGRPTSTSATRRSMSSSRPAAAALARSPTGGLRAVGVVWRVWGLIACFNRWCLVVSDTHTLLHAVRGPRRPQIWIRESRSPYGIKAASCVPYPTGRYPHGRILYNPSDQEYNPCNDIIPPRRLEIYLRTIYDRPLTGLARVAVPISCATCQVCGCMGDGVY